MKSSSDSVQLLMLNDNILILAYMTFKGEYKKTFILLYINTYNHIGCYNFVYSINGNHTKHVTPPAQLIGVT